MGKNHKEVNYAFIDSQNLNLGIKSRGWVLDWGKFRLLLRNKYKVEKAFLFIGYIERNTRLYEYLQGVGYILIFKNVLEIHKGKKVYCKGNVDAELVLHTMILLAKFDKAIIVSGDGDFFCLIKYLESKGKLYKILTPNERYSSLIREYSKYIVDVSKLRNKLEIKK
ncbi:MAG: NYN domain-containing protein [Candidatus Dojkabacteria bacterium]